MTIKVLLVEDQTLVRAGFSRIIETQSDMEVVAGASDGAEAVELSRRYHPHVVLMDIRMPNMDGIQATEKLTSSNMEPRPRVIILTTYDLDEYVFDALDTGASGFLLKDVPPEDLVRAIRETAEGQSLLAPTVTRRLIERFVASPRPSKDEAKRLDRLTDRETEVLGLVARGMSNAEIAGALFLGESTIKTHMGHILDKLGLRDRVQAVIVAYETGLIRPGEINERPNP